MNVEPALYRHAKTLYDGLEKDSKTANGVKTWTGAITTFFKRLGIPNAYYSDVTQFLSESGCITMTVRGARGVSTELVLHREPQLDEAENWRLTQREEGATLSATEQRVQELIDNIGGINIKEAFRNLDTRIKKLEGKTQRTEVRHGKSKTK